LCADSLEFAIADVFRSAHRCPIASLNQKDAVNRDFSVPRVKTTDNGESQGVGDLQSKKFKDK